MRRWGERVAGGYRVSGHLCSRAAGGAAALFESQPFERALRDVHAAMGHIIFQRPAMEEVGRVAFGLAPLSPTF
jgi:predicted enzyme related to lactoylglutathione lyase